jgi:DNA polymerase theta
LYKAGLRTPLAIAEASVHDILKALFESSSWTGQEVAGPQRMHLGIAKKIKNGARKIVLDQAEEARLAAFATFKSLGLNVPQVSKPLLPQVSDSSKSVNEASKTPQSSKSENEPVNSDVNLNCLPTASRSQKEGICERNVNCSNNDTQGAANCKGPINAANFSGGFNSFLSQWAQASDFYFDLHFMKQSDKSSSTIFEIIGLAVCWEGSPVYYCNFSKDLFSVSDDVNKTLEVAKVRWHNIVEIMGRAGVRKIAWNLKIQIQALKSPVVSIQRLGRLGVTQFNQSHGIEFIDNSHVKLQPILLCDATDMSIGAWILWPDEESKAAPNIDKVEYYI